MDVQEMCAMVAEVSDRMWNQGETGAVDKYFGTGFVANMPGTAAPLGTAGFVRLAEQRHEALSGVRHRVLQLFGQGDLVFLRSEVSGVHSGLLSGVPATGRHIELTEITMWRFEGGKVAELWYQGDDFRVLDQLGLVPPEGGGLRRQLGHAAQVVGLFAGLGGRGGRPRPAPLRAAVDGAGGDGRPIPVAGGDALDLGARALELARRVFDERDLGALDECATPDARYRVPGRPVLDNEGFKALVRHLWRAQPDLRVDVLNTVVEAPYVGVRARFTATHLGELFGNPPTGRPIDMVEMLVQTFDEQGRMVELCQEADYLGLLGGIGVLPPPDAGPLRSVAHLLAGSVRRAR
ncbi:ester cyclase [Streptomyces sp. NPDC058045]|uniref:ester cyclase n=1 Tax=Streptomyces sp. NPDC058045 TaxID=3346311 RepID=UPI0036EF2478